MSKKDKSKFRRRLKAQILQEMAKVGQVKGLPATASHTPVASPVSQPVARALETPTTAAPAIAAAAGTLQLVRHDLKKSAIIIGSIIIIIIVLYFVDQKTGILLKVGNEIFKVLHIGS